MDAVQVAAAEAAFLKLFKPFYGTFDKFPPCSTSFTWTSGAKVLLQFKN